MMAGAAAAHSQGCGQHALISLLRDECKQQTLNKHCSVCENPKLGRSLSHACLHIAGGSLPTTGEREPEDWDDVYSDR